MRNNFMQRRSASASPDEAAGPKSDEEAISLYVVLSDMKHQLDSKSKESQRFIEQLKTQDEHTRQLLHENTQLQADL